MFLLSSQQLKTISGGIAMMSGGFSMGPNGTTFQPGFSITVTDTSSNVLGNFAAYPDSVVDLATETVLFDGTQNSFCYNGSYFSISPMTNGHCYTYVGHC